MTNQPFTAHRLRRNNLYRCSFEKLEQRLMLATTFLGSASIWVGERASENVGEHHQALGTSGLIAKTRAAEATFSGPVTHIFPDLDGVSTSSTEYDFSVEVSQSPPDASNHVTIVIDIALSGTFAYTPGHTLTEASSTQEIGDLWSGTIGEHAADVSVSLNLLGDHRPYRQAISHTIDETVTASPNVLAYGSVQEGEGAGSFDGLSGVWEWWNIGIIAGARMRTTAVYPSGSFVITSRHTIVLPHEVALRSTEYLDLAALIVPDTGNAPYSGAHYVDSNRDGTPELMQPAAVEAGQVLRARVSLQFRNQIPNVEIKGVGEDGIEFGPAVLEEVDRIGLSTLYEAVAVSTLPLPGLIDQDKSYEVDWYFSRDSGDTWEEAGTSANPLYVIGANTGNEHFETVVDIATRNAVGKSANERPVLVDAIWSDFVDLEVLNVAGETLHYYGDPTSGNRQNNFDYTISGLLRERNAQCRAWSQLFLDALLVHGIAGNYHVTVGASLPAGLLDQAKMVVRNVTVPAKSLVGNTGFSAFSGDLIDPFTGELYEIEEVMPALGLRGQGPTYNPDTLFSNHQIALVDGTFYDPSYGTTYADGFEMQAAAVQLIGGRGQTLVFEADTFDINQDGDLQDFYRADGLFFREPIEGVQELRVLNRELYGALPVAAANTAIGVDSSEAFLILPYAPATRFGLRVNQSRFQRETSSEPDVWAWEKAMSELLPDARGESALTRCASKDVNADSELETDKHRGYEEGIDGESEAATIEKHARLADHVFALYRHS